MKYGTKIRGVFPYGRYEEGMTGLEFMKTGFDNFPFWGTPMLCQEKMDGWFGIVARGDGDCYWDNGWNQYSVLNEMLDRFNEFVPKQSILIGEVGYGTEAETRFAEENGYHRFTAIDTLLWDGLNISKSTSILRYNHLVKSLPKRKDTPIVKTILLNRSSEENKKDAYDMFMDVYNDGGEGIVLKDYWGTYEINGQSSSMYKVKKFITKDYVCMGFTKSVANSYMEQGMDVSSMECGLFVDGAIKYSTKTSGFDFEWRKRFSEHPERYIGRVVELGGFEVFKSGAMRHSSFLRFREDREITDCTL